MGLESDKVIYNLGGKVDFYLKILSKFYEGDANSFKEIEKNLREKDYKKAGFNIHTLKGVCGNIGAKKLAGLLGDLENDLIENQKFEDKVLVDIENELLVLREALEIFSIIERRPPSLRSFLPFLAFFAYWSF